ncbi:MAG: DMT family transporter [Clostridia bacterium]|nr:DMT family transporter [Clostridia bacterium]
MKKSNLKGSLILCLAALLWGLAFVVQNDAADKIPPFAFNSMRSFIGAAFLFGFMGIKSISNKEYVPVPKTMDKKLLLTGSIVCGVVLAISTNFQQFGIAAYPDGVPTEARSGFLTALYVIIVPLLSVFVRKKVPIIVWLSALVAIGGFYMLCLFEGVSGFYFADILVLGCTLAFSLHIIVIDKYCDAIGAVRLSAFQFIVCGIVSGFMSLIFESDLISLSNIISVIPQILYMGIVSSGIAYTLQTVGQKYAEPAIASISMSLESVFAALGGWVITGNALKGNEIIGCLLVFAAIVLAQTPEFFKKKIQNI